EKPMSDSQHRVAAVAAGTAVTPIDRRSLLAATLALTLVPLGISAARAAAVPYTFRHGAFDITVISDGYFVLPPPNLHADVGFLFPDTPRPQLEAYLKSVGMSIDRVQLPNNVVLLRTMSDLILIDTGAGNGWQPTAGKLVENLKAAGIDPATITKIVFTHAHPDHLWGVADDGGALRFSSASYFISQREWKFLTAEDTLQKLPENFPRLAVG